MFSTSPAIVCPARMLPSSMKCRSSRICFSASPVDLPLASSILLVSYTPLRRSWTSFIAPSDASRELPLWMA